MKQQPKQKKSTIEKKIFMVTRYSRMYFEYCRLQMGMSVPKIRYVSARLVFYYDVLFYVVLIKCPINVINISYGMVTIYIKHK